MKKHEKTRGLREKGKLGKKKIQPAQQVHTYLIHKKLK